MSKSTAQTSAPPLEHRRPDLVDLLLVADLAKADALIEASELYGDDAERELSTRATSRDTAYTESTTCTCI